MHHGIIIWEYPWISLELLTSVNFSRRTFINLLLFIIKYYKHLQSFNMHEPAVYVDWGILSGNTLFGNRQFTCLYIYICTYIYIYVEEVHWKAIRGIQYSLHTLIVYRQFTSMGDVPESRIWLSDSDLEWSLDVVAENYLTRHPSDTISWPKKRLWLKHGVPMDSITFVKMGRWVRFLYLTFHWYPYSKYTLW